MKTVKIHGSNQNKFGDTEARFKAQLMNDDVLINISTMPTKINIANGSGYILTVEAVDFEDENIVIDFNNSDFRKLTPDDYWLEFEVTLEDGDIAKFPTTGGMPFTINQNLKSATGQLVPTVTFQQVLDAVDAKVDEYVHTIQKGDKGDTGGTGATGQSGKDGTNGTNGKDGDVMQGKDNTFTGKNKFTQPINGNIMTNEAQFTDFAVVAQNMTTYNGSWFVGGGGIKNGYNGNSITYVTITVISGNATGTGFISYSEFGSNRVFVTVVDGGNIRGFYLIANDNNVLHQYGNETTDGVKTFKQPIVGSLASRPNDSSAFQNLDDLVNNMRKYAGNWSLLLDGKNFPSKEWAIVQVIPFNDSDKAGTISVQETSGSKRAFIAMVNIGIAYWKEIADNGQVLHNTGNETAAGDKTFTGSVIIQDANPVKVKQSSTTTFPMWYNSTMEATRFGNMVTLHYVTRTSQDIPNGTVSSQTIPAGFKPNNWWYMSSGGNSNGLVEIGTDGKLYVRGSNDVPYPHAMTATYFTNDPFPS